MMTKLFTLGLIVLSLLVSGSFAQNSLKSAVGGGSLRNALGMGFVTLPPGEFFMGSDESDVEFACKLTKDLGNSRTLPLEDSDFASSPARRSILPAFEISIRLF